MDDENEILDDDLLEPEDEHAAKLREIAYWASDVYETADEPRDELLAFAVDDVEDDE